MNKQVTTIYVVRHGESYANANHDDHTFNHKQYGEYQSPLTEKGEAQAKEIAKQLSHIHFDAIFSSDLTRARQTAEFIADTRNISVQTVSTIRERNFGEQFYALPKEERQELQRALRALSDEEKMTYKFFPDSESQQEALGRFQKFLKEIIPLYKGKTILVVNHGNIMRMFLYSIAWALFDEIPSGTVKNTGYFVVETDGTHFTVKETYGIHKAGQEKTHEE